MGIPTLDSRHQTQDAETVLLISWCLSILSLVIITIRVCGRYIRIRELFPEDKVMMSSMVPLMSRMALVHVVLLWGTNNTQNGTTGMSSDEISHREIGSRLVLGARVFYAVLYTHTTSFQSSPQRRKANEFPVSGWPSSPSASSSDALPV